jgi:hypothetical protein
VTDVWLVWWKKQPKPKRKLEPDKFRKVEEDHMVRSEFDGGRALDIGKWDSHIAKLVPTARQPEVSPAIYATTGRSHGRPTSSLVKVVISQGGNMHICG